MDKGYTRICYSASTGRTVPSVFSLKTVLLSTNVTYSFCFALGCPSTGAVPSCFMMELNRAIVALTNAFFQVSWGIADKVNRVISSNGNDYSMRYYWAEIDSSLCKVDFYYIFFHFYITSAFSDVKMLRLNRHS